MSLFCVCTPSLHSHRHRAVDISEINVGQPIFGTEMVNNEEMAIFHINFIKLIDTYLTERWKSKGIQKILTDEQERFLNRYFYECDFVTKNGDDKYEYMDKTLRFLDRVLGSYSNETTNI